MMKMSALSFFMSTLLLLVVSILLHGINAYDVAGGAPGDATKKTVRKLMFRDQPLAGGFQHVEDIDQQPMIQEAAAFALQTMQDTTPYEFGAQATRVKIIDAWQQVVQGMNFQLTLEFQGEDEECVGACSVLVYNQFGTLSVTKWNKEITCEEAKELMEDGEGDEN
jgi:Cystatin domain